MKIFPDEISDGLEEAIASSNSLAFISQLESDTSVEDNVSLDPKQHETLAAHLGERPERDTYDLYSVKTILVSTGWNGNDDIFDKGQVWAARHSPEDKPFNLEHAPRHIIGHITNNVGVDVDQNIIVDDININHLPDSFHIVTSAVIYRHLGPRDKVLTEEAAEIIAGIKGGDWFVSMECLFDGFDYGLRDPSTGRIEKVIARQESTAFLTKHLRAYNGTGQYNGYSIGRVLRNITFTGKGLVKKPANTNSTFIFNDMEAFAGKLVAEIDVVEILDDVDTPSTIVEGSSAISASIGVDTVDETNNTLEDKVTHMSENRIKELENELAESKRRLVELDEKSVQTKFDVKDATIAEHLETIAGLNTQVEEFKANAKKSEETKAEVEKALEEKTKEADGVVAELDTIKTEATRVDRISTLVDKGLEKEKAEEIVAKFLELDDEKFTSVADLIEVSVDTIVSEASKESNDSTKTDEEKEEAEASDETSLENAEEETEPDMAAASEDAKATKEESTASLSSYIGNFLKRSRNGNKSRKS